jgi:hypothetical protein
LLVGADKPSDEDMTTKLSSNVIEILSPMKIGLAGAQEVSQDSAPRGT